MPFFKNIRPHAIKIIAGAIGAYGAGTAGLGIGLIIGAAIDYWLNRSTTLKSSSGNLKLSNKILSLKSETTKVSSKNEIKDFIASTLLLSAIIVKSDGFMNNLEEGYLRRFLSEQFGDKHSVEYLALLKSFVVGNFDIVKTCTNICIVNNYETRLQMLYIIIGVANSDFNMDETEIMKIKQIAGYLQIDKYDFQSILAMYQDELTAAYQILELRPSATDSDVGKYYQLMALKYHPDKLAHLGEIAVNTAKLKYNKVVQAYESIKKERGFK